MRGGCGEGGLEALAMPACIATIANKHEVGLSPGVCVTAAASNAVEAFALSRPGVPGRVHRQPVVAAAEAGGGGSVLQRDEGVGKVGLAGRGKARVDGGVVCAL